MSDIDNSGMCDALEAARSGVTVDSRITEIEHPDDEGTAVVVVSNTDSDGNTSVEVASDIMAALDSRLPAPRRRAGVVQLTEVASLIEHVKRYGDESTVIYANTKALAFAVVYDENPAGPAGGKIGSGTAWREFRATYACPRSPEWIAWTGSSDAAMRQEQFADFLEQRLEDMAAAEGFPKPIELLTIARQLHIKTKGEFRREVNPTNGDNILVCKTETETGSTQIPRAFALAIPVFEGGARYHVEARIRFALVGGVPQFSYTLHRRAEIERDAFDEVRSRIASETGRLVLAGSP